MNTWLVYCRFQRLRGTLTSAAYDQEMDLVRQTLGQLDEAHWKEYLDAWK
jgi:hypothetical protein